ncbi:calcium-binding protein [Tsuneonella sp. HG222]
MPAANYQPERGFKLGSVSTLREGIGDANDDVLANGNLVTTFTTTYSFISRASTVNVVVQSLDGGIVRQFTLTLPGLQSEADVLATSDGGFAITWAQASYSSSTGQSGAGDIYLQRFDAQGNARSEPVLVNAVPDSGFAPGMSDHTPTVAELGDGSLAIAWVSTRSGSADIYASIFSPTGQPVAQDILVHANTAGSQEQPVVIDLGSGNFLVAWHTNTGPTGENDGELHGQVFDRTGARVGGEFLINTQNAGDQFAVSAATLANGNAIVVWESNLLIKAQLFDPSGNRVGTEFTVAPQQFEQMRPYVAPAVDGGFVVGWIDNGAGIAARSFNADTTPLGDAFRVVEGLVSSFELDLQGQGGLAVSYSIDRTVYSRLLTSVPAQTITGSPASEDLYGNSLDNTIYGLAGNDQLFGGAGNDRLFGGTGINFIDGGPGIDTVDFSGWGYPVQVDLLNNVAAHEDATDYVFNVENVIGSAFADVLIGDAQENRLEGGSGDDLLAGGAGADALIGGAGSDTASYEGNFGGVFVNLTLGKGYTNFAFGDTYDSIENVLGSSFADFLIGDPGINRLDGGPGNDTVIGGIGPDILIGGAGSDTLSFEDNSGTVFVDLKSGKGYNNAAQGDTFSGFENVIGGLFDDTLIGDDGANFLDGAMGADTLVGAGGADTFAFSYAPGATSVWGSPNVDTIVDFKTGEDKLAISSAAFGGVLTPGALPSDRFLVGSAAGDSNDRFVYDQASGKLYFDADGNGSGAPVLMAMFLNHDPVAASDFVIV